MSIVPTYPGVYVSEVPSETRTIAGVPTSIALFIGASGSGPINTARQVFNYTEFAGLYGEDASVGDLARSVRLFFLNGGTQAYIVRTAKGAGYASVDLHGSTGATGLTLAALDAGMAGEFVRANVTYSGLTPEATFDLSVWRAQTDGFGNVTQSGLETYKGLTMDVDAPTYAEAYLNQRSAVVGATDPTSIGLDTARSTSGRVFSYDDVSGTDPVRAAAYEAALADVIAGGTLKISAEGSDYVEVAIGPVTSGFGVDIPTSKAAIESHIAMAINTELSGPLVEVEIREVAAIPASSGNTKAAVLEFRSQGNAGDIRIKPGSDGWVSTLLLGPPQGGVEISRYSGRRPRPNGITLFDFDAVAGWPRGELTLTLDGIDPVTEASGTHDVTVDLTFDGAATGTMWEESTGGHDGVGEALRAIRDAVNAYASANRRWFFWDARVVGKRLILQLTAGADNDTSPSFAAVIDSGPTTVTSDFDTPNVRNYSVGVDGGSQGAQTNPATRASDGSPPEVGDYEDAMDAADREVDLFNLLVLPEYVGSVVHDSALYGVASAFAERRRALLLLDSPIDWVTAKDAADGVDALRVGLVTDHAAVFHPRITIDESGREHHIGAAGAIAGVMARTDASRGVWKAPAGLDATITGVVGIQRAYTDPENGAMNPRAVNVVRLFPSGVTVWGSRTLAGDDDFADQYKYVPVRRLALNIQESLYRGLKWVVFEPNGALLWSRIRTSVGAFMNNLYRQGAFAGTTKSQAYFVKCDSETTTQNDQNLGIVNILVGFAPLNPAEFVIVKLSQMTGDVQT